jgi:hypothetical protein
VYLLLRPQLRLFNGADCFDAGDRERVGDCCLVFSQRRHRPIRTEKPTSRSKQRCKDAMTNKEDTETRDRDISRLARSVADLIINSTRGLDLRQPKNPAQ